MNNFYYNFWCIKWQASDVPFTLSADELDQRIKQNMEGENRYFDGKTFISSSTLSKAVRKSWVLNVLHLCCASSHLRFLIMHIFVLHNFFFLFLIMYLLVRNMRFFVVVVMYRLQDETHVYTEGSARFIYGHGSAYKQHWDITITREKRS